MLDFVDFEGVKELVLVVEQRNYVYTANQLVNVKARLKGGLQNKSARNIMHMHGLDFGDVSL